MGLDAKRQAMADAIRQQFDNERGFSIGFEANAHVLTYWKSKLNGSGRLESDSALNHLLSAAIKAGNKPNEKGVRL